MVGVAEPEAAEEAPCMSKREDRSVCVGVRVKAKPTCAAESDPFVAAPTGVEGSEEIWKTR